MEQLETPEYEMVRKGHFLQGHVTHLAFEIFCIIQQKYPKKIKNAIEEPKVKMLVLMKTIFLLCFAHPHPGLNVNIIIDPIHIGVGMVNDIMLHIPHKAVAAQYIQGKSRQAIDPFVLRKAPVRPVMHHIEADGGYHTAQQNAFHNGPKSIGSKEHEMDIDKQEAYHQNN